MYYNKKSKNNNTIPINFVENKFMKVTYLTTHTNTNVAPETGKDGWTKCFYSETALGAEFIVVCDNNRTPYIKQFAIRRTDAQSISLKEVLVFGYSKLLRKIGKPNILRFSVMFLVCCGCVCNIDNTFGKM